MKYKILKNPVGIVEFELNTGEQVVGEKGSLVYLQGDIETKTRMRKSGFWGSLKATVLGGESFFVNEYTANEDGTVLALTGKAIGDLEVIDIEEEFIIQSGAFVCSTGDLTLDTQWQGFKKGIFGTNLFMLKTIGTGKMFVNSWGGIMKKTLDDGESILVDNYQLVGFNSLAEYDVIRHGSWKTTFLGGEALIVEIIGPATVYIQTKNVLEFVGAITPYLPKPDRQY